MIRMEARIGGLGEYGEGTFRGKRETVKVPRAYPGDQVRVSFEPDGRPFVSARLESLVKPSPHRRDPACPHFTEGCGGCHWRGLDYAVQTEWKSRILADVLARKGGLQVPVAPVIALPSGPEGPSEYRNKMSLVNHSGSLAFLKDHSDQPVFPRDCPVEVPVVRQVWEAIRDMKIPPEVLQVHLRGGEDGDASPVAGINFFVKNVTPAVRELAVRLAAMPGVAGVGADSYRFHEHLEGAEGVRIPAGPWRFYVPLEGFFQTNTPLAPVLLDKVMEGLGTPRTVLDLYCGAGFFSLPAATRAKEVLGIETNRASVAQAERNLKDHESLVKARVAFRAADVGRTLRDLAPRAWDAVILDPPRSGCGEGVIPGILRLRPRHIVYVSCSPDSLARDLKELTREYRVVSCTPVDLFPHTFHMESIVVLARESRR